MRPRGNTGTGSEKLLRVQNAVHTSDGQASANLPVSLKQQTAHRSVWQGREKSAPYLIQLLVVGHSQQDVPGRDPSLLVVSCCIACQFQNLSCGEQRGRASGHVRASEDLGHAPVSRYPQA